VRSLCSANLNILKSLSSKLHSNEHGRNKEIKNINRTTIGKIVFASLIFVLLSDGSKRLTHGFHTFYYHNDIYPLMKVFFPTNSVVMLLEIVVTVVWLRVSINSGVYFSVQTMSHDYFRCYMTDALASGLYVCWF
jgi:fumarate reductase subunit D